MIRDPWLVVRGSWFTTTDIELTNCIRQASAYQSRITNHEPRTTSHCPLRVLYSRLRIRTLVYDFFLPFAFLLG
jgi:hypothetical protein